MAKIVKNLPPYHWSLFAATTLAQAKRYATKVEKRVMALYQIDPELKILDYGNKPVKMVIGKPIKYAVLVPAKHYKKIDATW